MRSVAIRDIVLEDGKSQPRWMRKHRERAKGGYEPLETINRDRKKFAWLSHEYRSTTPAIRY